jgi:hypothetical protein
MQSPVRWLLYDLPRRLRLGSDVRKHAGAWGSCSWQALPSSWRCAISAVTVGEVRALADEEPAFADFSGGPFHSGVFHQEGRGMS